MILFGYKNICMFSVFVGTCEAGRMVHVYFGISFIVIHFQVVVAKGFSPEIRVPDRDR